MATTDQPHFTEEETEAQKGEVTCPRSHNNAGFNSTLCLLSHRVPLCSLWLLFGFWQLKPTKNSQLHTNPGVSKGQVQGAGVTRRVFLPTPWLYIPFAVVTPRNRQMGGPSQGGRSFGVIS